MPTCAKEEVSESPTKSIAASAMVEIFIFIVRCSMSEKSDAVAPRNIQTKSLPGLKRGPSQHDVIGSAEGDDAVTFKA